jgi:hypothetical protein
MSLITIPPQDIFSMPDVPLPNSRGEFQCPADGAKWMASFGIPQIVIRGKIPFMTEWQNKGTTDFEQIDQWAAEYPGCNFGSIAKRSLDGHFALEVDSVDVRMAYRKETGQDFTASLIIQSGEGRGHRWYQYDANSLDLQNIGQEDAAGFSLRVNNEQCVSPGSVHPERLTQYVVKMDHCSAPTPPSAHEIAWFKSKKAAPKIQKAEEKDGTRVLIRHGAIYAALISQAGKLWNNGFPPAEIPDMLVSWAHENCAPPIDETKVRSYAKGANWKQGEPGAEWVYSGGQSDAQEDYRAAADKADEVEANESVEEMAYPLHIWKGTPYYDFAVLATQDNYIPPAYLINGLMTVTGAIAGHRIFPKFSPKMPAHLYTVLLSTIGGIGKNETLQWSADCYEGTGLLYQSGTNSHKNIGAIKSDFGSARGAIDEFMQNSSILQEYGELTTPLEKFGISGSGTSFLDLMNNTYDSINPNWSKIKGSKLPAVLPAWINNSMLSATTVKRWHDRMGESNLETFIQRLNIVPTTETRTVFQLTTPDVSEIRKRLMDRVGLLEEYKLMWHYGAEATEIGRKWHADMMQRIGASVNEEDVDLSEVFGRIQVFAHRIVGHLALWLGELPMTPAGPAKPSFVEGTAVPYVRKSEGEDKVWSVEVTGDMMSRAIEAAEFLVKARTLMMPAEGHDVKAKIENLITKWAVRTRYIYWSELKRRANLRKYSSRDAAQCLLNVERTGILTVRKDPGNPGDERQWVVVWMGDGKKTPKWRENRGWPLGKKRADEAKV